MSDPIFKFVDPTNQIVVRTWPDGTMESHSVVAQIYLDWLAAGNATLPADPVPPAPDADGFVLGIKEALGGIVAANALMRAYPAFYDAVATGTWSDVAALIEDAQTTGALNAEQYAAFKQLASAHNIPIALP